MTKSLIVLALWLSACTPRSYPYSVALKPPANPYVSASCRVRVEPLTFDPNARWGGKSEAEFIASLRPEAQASHQGDVVAVPEEYFKWLKVNEPGYLGNLGSITTGPAEDEPFVVRGRITQVKLGSGDLTVVHEVYRLPERTKIAEFTVTGEVAAAYGMGHGMRASTIALSMGLLSYFRDHFGCTGRGGSR